MPRLDAPLEPLRLTAADGSDTVLSELAAARPVVLAMLDAEPVPGDRLEMLREVGRRLRTSGIPVLVVTPAESVTARTLEAEGLGQCLTDPGGQAFAALGLAERRIGRMRRRSGVFVVDAEGMLRFAYVAKGDAHWVPATFILSRLARLGAAPSGDPPAPAPTPAPAAPDGGEGEILALRVGEHLGMSESELADLATAARFRDLGMATVPDEIIAKLGPLTDAESAIVRSHPERSAEMLGTGALFDGARGIIRANHEHPDGSGYPNGLTGEAIPLGARILVVVEAYLAMTEERPYRHRLEPHTAVEDLERRAGTAYDLTAVAALVRVLREAPATAA